MMQAAEFTERLAALKKRVAALAANLPARLEAAAQALPDEAGEHLESLERDVEGLEAAVQDNG